MSMDITAFYQTFFDEADELLADMEQHLLLLDPLAPDNEQLNAIFRAAHSIKGGAATFGFSVLQETTHLLENLLDGARRDEMRLSTDIINLFLETKDIMQEQLDAYKTSQEPNAESFEYICHALRQLALEALEQQTTNHVATAASSAETKASSKSPALVQGGMRIRLSGLKEQEIPLMLEELGNLGDVKDTEQGTDSLEATLITSVSEDDISAVLCFVLEPEQISFVPAELVQEPVVEVAVAAPIAAQVLPVAAAPIAEAKNISKVEATSAEHVKPKAKASESTSIRVAVEKVDQLINLVGELVITQSMLAQRSSTLDPVINGDLLNSMGQLERNARDLQESVMSIRMMPMEYVFSRFPRLVRDLASKLNKQVELTLLGSSTELDKSLIERIIDPLTHLVRNSLDHGIEDPATRIAAGKAPVGNLTLSAEHQGGNICIEVLDDGAGLNRQKILAKAQSQGMAVNEHMTDEDVGMLIFAPGFSTAEQVTDVSGRGVGMDVVKRNIQEMGGHVQVSFQAGKGTSIRILLPLTLAILDGMSVKVSDEVFILPLNAVMESLQPLAEDLHPLAGGERVLQVRGEYLPLVELFRVFDVENAKTEATQGIVVILQSAGRRYALLVDQLIGQHQVVVKNLESNYRKVPGISAATILGDGSVALIVDVSALQALNREKRVTADDVAVA
ncbi:signal transducing histidine kinase, homodimeric domain protein [Yersinia rochesterensis]|uniref:Chemotaxis protein CheA n=2 Tax=Yersinia rochesterensis TaxID=1604335 RepID=A0ABM5SSX2_9GAMM|nr:signal transducing histidine kinase, homodimeric domain protein [Yersinia rochesterensis]AJI85422.1 chemotaxis protein CheA [Yersinia frederiksenii Y225]AJJ37651.1 signal transducing histidine kinase, homodimeric domain protein [Yersinia rochesterensis]CNH51321.1 chemotaxis protein CheA [Yersinia kristensenii]CRY59075.1 chemotaxis protein CheA [Yersinia kristensenii]